MSVRMRGFARRSTVAEVWSWIADHAMRISSESVALADACGRVLATDVASQYNVPGFDRAMMDGFAVRADAISGASPLNPIPLEVIGQALPGQPFAGALGDGEAVRVMTGAPQPESADSVLPVEQTQPSPVDPRAVEAIGDLARGKHVGRVGEDVRRGETVLTEGRRLRPQDLGVLSSIGIRCVDVAPRPRVALLVTGDEILPPGSPPQPPKIVDANSPMIAALVARDGGELASLSFVRDDPSEVAEAMQVDADILLVSGGSSVGQEDHAPATVRELGELAFHGVAMRPSSPAGIGRIGRALVFLLPGNPVSCLCAYDFFAGRAIRLLSGASAVWPYPRVSASLARKLSSVVGRVDYARVAWRHGEDSAIVEPIAVSGASVLTSTTRADGFVVIPEDCEGYAEGASVDVFLYGLDSHARHDPPL